MAVESKEEKEIARLLECKANHADPFTILQVDVEKCKYTDIKKRYNKISLTIHPDKCSFANANFAFSIANDAYKMLDEEKKFDRVKRIYSKKTSYATLPHNQEFVSADVNNGVRIQRAGSSLGLSATNYKRNRVNSVDEVWYEQQLQAVRLGDEAERKRVERRQKETKKEEKAFRLESDRRKRDEEDLF